MWKYLALAGALACLSLPAEARQPACVETGSIFSPSCMGNDFLAGVKSIRVEMHRERHARVDVGIPTTKGRPAGTTVAHPEGCPWRAFCGCGAAVRVFGSPVRSLWLAVEWIRRFPRTEPAPGMVAARRHHVMVLEADLGGGIWRVFDANSGHHMTRVHARSIAGFVVVNPRG